MRRARILTGVGALVLLVVVAWLAWVTLRLGRVEAYQRTRVAEWERAMEKWQTDERQSAEVVSRLLTTLDQIDTELREMRRDRERAREDAEHEAHGAGAEP